MEGRGPAVNVRGPEHCPSDPAVLSDSDRRPWGTRGDRADPRPVPRGAETY